MHPPPTPPVARRPRSITLDCPAKVNLALQVGKPDAADIDGLHPLASWMVAVNFADRLTLERLDDMQADLTESAFVFSYAADAPSPRRIDWPMQRDLTYRAHASVQLHIGRPLRVRAELVKRIPTGAGLGGGSSDAAAMIVGLNQLFDLQLSPDEMVGFATQLGSDVHFALAAIAGTPSAIVSGFGEIIEPAPPPRPLVLVLILPEFGCPTGPVYAAFDRLGLGRDGVDPEALRQLTRQGDVPDASLMNDLAPAACDVEPRLAALRDRLKKFLGRTPHVTGSGAACFVLANSTDDAKELAQRITQHTGVAAVPAAVLPTNPR